MSDRTVAKTDSPCRRPLVTAALAIAALGLWVVLGGCSKQGTTSDNGSGGGTAAAATTSSTLDDGPRAGASPIDEAKADQGEQLFKDKGCSACHAFGKRGAGPDLAGVSQRRTAKWIENQILHPDKMTKEDPISRKLFAEFALQMPNQGLTEAQAQAVLEYFKHLDHESAEKH